MPVTISVQNQSNFKTDVELLLSMDTKDPEPTFNDKMIPKKLLSPGESFKFNFGDPKKMNFDDKKFQNTVYLKMNSLRGATLKVSSAFTRKTVKKAKTAQDMSADWREEAMFADFEAIGKKLAEQYEDVN